MSQSPGEDPSDDRGHPIADPYLENYRISCIGSSRQIGIAWSALVDAVGSEAAGIAVAPIALPLMIEQAEAFCQYQLEQDLIRRNQQAHAQAQAAAAAAAQAQGGGYSSANGGHLGGWVVGLQGPGMVWPSEAGPHRLPGGPQ